MISACCVCFWCGQSMEWILMLTGTLPQQVSVGLQRQNHRPLWKTRQVRTHTCVDTFGQSQTIPAVFACCPISSLGDFLVKFRFLAIICLWNLSRPDFAWFFLHHIAFHSQSHRQCCPSGEQSVFFQIYAHAMHALHESRTKKCNCPVWLYT